MLENFSDLFDKLKNAQDAVDKGIENGLKTSGVRVMGTAKAKLGTYQPAVGPYPAWVTLKPITISRKLARNKKARKNYLMKHGSLMPSGSGDDAPLVDVGHLKAAITTDTKDIDKGIVYVGVSSGKVNRKNEKRQKEGKKKYSAPGEYAASHEFGSAVKNIPARPFLRPAVYENKDEIQDDIAEAIKEELENAWRN